MTFAIEKCEWNGLPPCRPFQISKGRTSGRTQLTQTNIILSLIDNNGQDQFFFTDLEALIKTYLTEGSESYTAKHLKLKLIDHYRDRLMILSQDGWMGVGVGWGVGCGWGWGVLRGWGWGWGTTGITACALGGIAAWTLLVVTLSLISHDEPIQGSLMCQW